MTFLRYVEPYLKIILAYIMFLKLCSLVIKVIGYVYVNRINMFYFNYTNTISMLHYSLISKALSGTSLILYQILRYSNV